MMRPLMRSGARLLISLIALSTEIAMMSRKGRTKKLL